MPAERLTPSKVLLIEDTMDDERLSLRTLRRLGQPLTVEVARDGQAALHALGLDGSSDAVLPDLVLCDLKLPKVDGDEILRQVRSADRLRSTPFVVFSSSDEPADVARCEAFGVSEYAVKPVDYEAYRERLTGIVMRHLAGALTRGLIAACA